MFSLFFYRTCALARFWIIYSLQVLFCFIFSFIFYSSSLLLDSYLSTTLMSTVFVKHLILYRQDEENKRALLASNWILAMYRLVLFLLTANCAHVQQSVSRIILLLLQFFNFILFQYIYAFESKFINNFYLKLFSQFLPF